MALIAVVDFETNGVGDDAQVCEVGMCLYSTEGDEVFSPASYLCSVDIMSPEARAVHHIALGECASFAPFSPERMSVVTHDAFAAHNSEFEARFFQSSKPLWCTYKAALRVWPDAPGHSNSVLRYWLEDAGKISLDPALASPSHRAGPDAYVTAHILRAMVREGVTSKQLSQWTREPPLLPRCPIGKFRNMPWSEVEAGFLGWMLRQPDMDAGLKWNAEREIKRRSGATYHE